MMIVGVIVVLFVVVNIVQKVRVTELKAILL